MGDVLLLLVVFAAGCLVGGGVAWWLLGRSRPVAATQEALPRSAPDSEVSQLASASRQLMTDLETRYQGRTAKDGEPPKRAPRKRQPRS